MKQTTTEIEPEVLTRVSFDTCVITPTQPMEVLTRVSTGLEPEELAAQIRADIERSERSIREAAFGALRIGVSLMWVRDNSQYGGLGKFIKQHFASSFSERTLYRYIVIAEKFAISAGLLDRKTHLLTDGAVVSEIVGTQLELFTDPNVKFEGAMKKLMKHVGERGLSDLYAEARRGGKTYERKDASGALIAGKGAGTKTTAQLKQQATEELVHITDLIDAWFKALHHTRIDSGLRAQADAVFEEARAKLKKVAA